MSLRTTIEQWIASLRSGDGDYKKLYTEDYLLLLQVLGINTPADDHLMVQLSELVKKNHPVTGEVTSSQARNLLLQQIAERNKVQK